MNTALTNLAGRGTVFFCLAAEATACLDRLPNSADMMRPVTKGTHRAEGRTLLTAAPSLTGRFGTATRRSFR